MKKISLTIVVMLVMSIFMGMFIITNEPVKATTSYVASTGVIQDVINNASAGDIIIINSTDATTVTYFTEDVVVNKSITLKSANGTAYTWINGSLNVTVDDVTIGASGQGFTLYEPDIGVGNSTVRIGDNASRDNVTIQYCTIQGGYHAVEIGRTAGTADENSNIVIYDCIINNCGGSAIYAGPGQLITSEIYVRAHNTSNTAYADILSFDGGNDVLIHDCSLYNSLTNGGAGINFTGASNVLTNARIRKNTIYNVDGYSPISIVSQSDACTVANILITFNELENNSGTYSEPAIRFDNLSGQITATNISAKYNNINTSGNDIEEQFGATGTYKNWTGTMIAYFNWYGVNTGGTFRTASHLSATPCLFLGSAVGDIWTYTDYLDLTGDTSGTIDAKTNAKTTVEINSSATMSAVVYPYASNPTAKTPSRGMHNFMEIGISDASDINYPVNITMYYTSADLTQSGRSESDMHGLIFYNETDASWGRYNNTYVDKTYSAGGYAGRTWALAYTADQLMGAVVSIDFDAQDAGTTSGTIPTTTTPSTVDTDGDGLSDALEAVLGSNPNLADSDGDGVNDYDEYIAGTGLMDATDFPSAVVGAFLGLEWYWWIGIVAIIIAVIVGILLVTGSISISGSIKAKKRKR